MGAHLSDRQWPKVKAKVMTLWLPQESSVLLVKYSLSFSPGGELFPFPPLNPRFALFSLPQPKPPSLHPKKSELPWAAQKRRALSGPLPPAGSRTTQRPPYATPNSEKQNRQELRVR